MRITIDCVKCVLGNVLDLAKNHVPEIIQREALTRELLEIAGQVSWAVSPPEYAAKLYAVVRKHTAGVDLYETVKDQSTAAALQLMPILREAVEAAADPFAARVCLAVGGNIIDYGVNPDFRPETIRERVLEALNSDFDRAACRRLAEAMERAGNILYVMDNCGEAVLDTLLLEGIREKVTIAVRGYPIFNDITRREIEASGLGGYRCVDTGDSTPGVSMCDSSDAFRAAVEASDLIIAKGQGNFETMEGFKRAVFFLFRAKCPVVRKFIGGAAENSIQIIGKNLP